MGIAYALTLSDHAAVVRHSGRHSDYPTVLLVILVVLLVILVAGSFRYRTSRQNKWL
ncbi:MAG: hypothetical protein M3Z25_19095 [Actinomycetota bacterium]|nr:hypothetical protein [Actinomycetota bacterium]